MSDILQIMLVGYLTIGILWALGLFGAMLSSKDSFRATYNGKPVTGFKKVLVIVVLALYAILLWPMSVGSVLLG